MKTAFVINGSAGGGGCDAAWLAQHREAMAALDAGDRITLARDGSELQAAVRRALEAGCERIVAGGGDGTVSAVASQLVGGKALLGVLPLGTLNHFAKDLGLPLQTEAALQLLHDGCPREVDVGEVNGRMFLNNSGLGLYPRIVHGREQRRQLGHGKWPAFAWATLAVLRRFPFLDLRLDADGQQFFHRAPFVFIGNNEYHMSGLRIGERDRLDSGRLSIYVAHHTGRWGLLRLALAALLGRLDRMSELRTLSTHTLRIDAAAPRLRVATDGELTLMAPPLQYRIVPRALRVIAPCAPAAG